MERNQEMNSSSFFKHFLVPIADVSLCQVSKYALGVRTLPEERGLEAAETYLIPGNHGQACHILPFARFCSLKAALLPPFVDRGRCRVRIRRSICSRLEPLNLSSEFVLVPRPRARSFGAGTDSRTKDEDEHVSTWLKNGSW
jgi:hypothetical protein